MKYKKVIVLLVSVVILCACSSKTISGDDDDTSNEVLEVNTVLRNDDVKDEEVIESEIIEEDDVSFNIEQKEEISSSESLDKPIDNNTFNNQPSVIIKDQNKEKEVIKYTPEAIEPKNEEPVIIPPVKEEEIPQEEVKPTPPPVSCAGGEDPNLACDVVLDTNYYLETYQSEQEANNCGQYYLDEVEYLNDLEITNYSVQPVYRNDHSVAYYGLNLWSNGALIY